MILEYLLIFVTGLAVAGSIGIVWHMHILAKRAADGTCIRADDGEVYLRLSEAAQLKLADPKTEILVLRVVNMSTRNNQPL